MSILKQYVGLILLEVTMTRRIKLKAEKIVILE